MINRYYPDVDNLPGAVFLQPNSMVAFVISARLLDSLIIQYVEKKITRDQYESRLREEVNSGRMMWAGKHSPLVELTGKTLGCLIEYRIPSSIMPRRLCYSYADCLEARPSV